MELKTNTTGNRKCFYLTVSVSSDTSSSDWLTWQFELHSYRIGLVAWRMKEEAGNVNTNEECLVIKTAYNNIG